MENEKFIINGYTICCYRINTLIIGSGAASLNAAVSLHSMGQKDILIATSQWGGGTSNNAGSDKQTYYKLSLSGSERDSVTEMAEDLFNGKCMHGDIALCEAQGSVLAFMNLVHLGVRFPHDKYGSWAGYKTDHDQRGRATSAGPYTSRRMFEALAGEVERLDIPVLDNHHCISLLTDKSGTKVIGALALNVNETDHKRAFVLFNSTNVILGTGGPAGIYETSVYPLSQNGSTGMALIAGATGQNLTESQFGIASIRFRWNLSGSYQQAIPRYISTDKNGNDEREFLNDSFPDFKSMLKAIFLKGYQWPFDPGKVSKQGSSLIDLLVHNEINENGRNVYIDYTRNPSWNHGEIFSLEDLDPVVIEYLKNSQALKGTPIERLEALNAPAIALYRENGIDLSTEPVQIAVCVQHNNGGLKANIWWESDLKHLFPVGEVNGSHGVYRPGGSALNSGQVGSFRAAQFISKKYKTLPVENSAFFSETEMILKKILALSKEWMRPGKPDNNNKYLTEIRKRMSESGGIIRDINNVKNACREASLLLKKSKEEIRASSVSELSDAFLLLDHCITHFVYLEAIRFYLKEGGRSRGSYIVINKPGIEGTSISENEINPELCLFDRDVEKKIIEVGLSNDIVRIKMEEVREIPKQDLWFERIWKEYLEEIYLDC
ncbi:MAG: FAD-binding protein [Bacteroidales bacterium]|nr:FAD-binding protein [Bacteroidales bacterium]